jgi:endonuclease YncB( thermonuclease family)
MTGRTPKYNRKRYRSGAPRRSLTGAFKASGRNFTAKLLCAAGMIAAILLGRMIGLPEWAALPLMLLGGLLGYFSVYNRGWRKWLGKRKARPPKFGKRSSSIGLGLVLGAIATLTVAVIVGLYFYHQRSGQEAPQLAGQDIFRCNVVRVIDGDTFDCLEGQRVRLHAIAAREQDGTCSPGHPCPSASARAATSKLRELVGGGAMQCKPTGETYGRVAAICMNSNGVEVNCAMVRSGTALRWSRYEQRGGALCSGRYGSNEPESL